MGKNDGAGALNPAIRASDADRERVVEILRQNNVEGRLTSDEFEERMSAAYAAKTMGALAELTTDLPVDLAAHTRQQAELARRQAAQVPMTKQMRAAVSSWASLAVVLTVIWAVTGAGYYWPGWPLGVLAALGLSRGIKEWGRR
ncbi:DUF1707 SHOCT-like domain-containing protein [Actinospica robiniae]|uniref:DUF1707 SHOCT-like domain-containing protein n=1 Tax=Actinospica robiniae TaxID=304901 RepID=UPI00040D0878|nr:DUF1707 domain-containing protein [Actinospica robiniae]